MWYFQDDHRWRWVHPEEYVTYRQARSEGEFRHYGEGKAIQLNLKGQPVPPRTGRPKRGGKVSWADLHEEEFATEGLDEEHGDGQGPDGRKRPPKPPAPHKVPPRKAPPAILEALAKGGGRGHPLAQ